MPPCLERTETHGRELVRSWTAGSRSAQRGPGGCPDPGPDSEARPDGASPELRRDHDHSSGELGLGSRNAVASGALTRSRQRASGDETHLTFHLEEWTCDTN